MRGYCGTQSSPVADAQLDANIAYLAAHPDVLNTRGITYVPVRFTIVRPASGNGGVNPKSVFRMFCKLNEDYLDQDIQFYMKDDFKYLNNDLANTDPQSSSGGSILKNVKDKTALNIFFVEEIKSSSPGSVLGFLVRRMITLSLEIVRLITNPKPLHMRWDTFSAFDILSMVGNVNRGM